MLKVMEGKNLNQRLLYPAGSHSDFMKKSKALHTSKS